jgi:hypothetical protein
MTSVMGYVIRGQGQSLANPLPPSPPSGYTLGPCLTIPHISSWSYRNLSAPVCTTFVDATIRTWRLSRQRSLLQVHLASERLRRIRTSALYIKHLAKSHQGTCPLAHASSAFLASPLGRLFGSNRLTQIRLLLFSRHLSQPAFISIRTNSVTHHIAASAAATWRPASLRRYSGKIFRKNHLICQCSHSIKSLTVRPA